MAAYLEALEEHREELDSLNVYPVPDGDTGTNLVFTQRAVVSALDALPNGAGSEADLRGVCDAIASASLLAARGNSGVILAQVLRGLCDPLALGDGDGRALAGALAEASREAYRAVASPQEGTALTVLREAAEAAAVVVPPGGSAVVDVAAAALSASRRSLAATREALPALRRAGVVDAGGLGVVLLLDALLATLKGTGRIIGVGPPGPVGDHSGVVLEGPDQGFEVQFMLSGDRDPVAGLREQLARLGTSLSVGGDDALRAFHIHTNQPARVIETARAAGTVIRETVVPLGVPVVTGLVAVADGPGVVSMLRELGAEVVGGGADDEAHAPELAAAIDRAPGSSGVVVLLDRPASLIAAERTAGNATRPARVVAAGSAPAALAAATAHNPALDLEADVAEMRTAASACVVGEVCEVCEASSSSGTSDAADTAAGSWVATRDGAIVLVAPDAATAAVGLVAELAGAAPQADVLTIVLGDGLVPATDPVVAALRRSHPAIRISPVAGGQAGTRYVIGVR